MALIATKISSRSCFVSAYPNNSPTFLISKFPNTVDSLSPANTAKRSILRNVHASVSDPSKQFHNKTSLEYSHELNIKKIKNILSANVDVPSENLEMIDVIQSLGIDLHFRQEIEQTLHMIYKEGLQFNGDLHEIALRFRLLRQEGHYVQESIFKNILDKKGGFKDVVKNDVKGLTELFEASELRVEGEETLDGAREFTYSRLNELCSGRESHQKQEIMKSLAQPRHKTVRGLTSKRWWTELGLEKDVEKARSQPLKWHTWSMKILQDPTLTEQRLDLTKPISLVYVIDDIFDVYGELEELTIFTRVVERWDHKGLKTLPKYMRVCFEALDMITTEISMKIYKSHGWNPTYALRQSWASLCKAFLVEAKWFNSGYLPTTEEYMKNGVVSSGVHLVMLHAYILLGEELTKEKVELIESNPGIVSSAATILRLWDDLGSAKDENQDGTDGSYVECYLNEYKGSTVDEARTHVAQKISRAWKRLNRECLNPCPFSRSFSKACLNIARTVPLMYSYDDDQRLPDEYLKSLM
ncbi:unnamed protein product [Arabidopsis thaliana]|uniref:Uncharacterized protein n=1 Tax=Arabidopsis thaliana TaxID=3702 RepID=A0A654EVU5_ARATH|nr:unnamed protein product [Arabidopsis thaliana]